MRTTEPKVFISYSWAQEVRGTAPIGGVKTMAMSQRDDTIEAIKRHDALLEYVVMHGDEAEAACLRAELKRLVEKV